MASSDFHAPRIAVMTSHSAAGIESLVADRNRGSLYNLVAILGSERGFAEQELVESAGIPTLIRPIRSFQEERRAPLRNLLERSDYDADTADILRRLEIDYVILAGYRYIVTESLLTAFPQRVIALHDGDLTVCESDGQRSYTGLHAVRNAIYRGAAETRCSAYLVTRTVGEGPLFLLSGAYPVAPMAADARAWGAGEMLAAYADLHRRWMQRSAWGGMLLRITEMIAAGTIQIVGDVVWVDGVPGPCRMGEAPSVCLERDKAVEAGIPASCPFIRS